MNPAGESIEKPQSKELKKVHFITGVGCKNLNGIVCVKGSKGDRTEEEQMRKFRSNERVQRNTTSSMQLFPMEGRGRGCDATKEEPRKTGWRGGEEVGLHSFLLEEMAQMEMKALTEPTPPLMTA